MNDNKLKTMTTKHQQAQSSKDVKTPVGKPQPVMVKESWNPRGDTARLKNS